MSYRTIAALSCLTLLAACQELPPGQYKLGLQEAYERLAKGDWRDFITERQCGILVHLSTHPQSDRAITWRVRSDGQEMLNFTAVLTPVTATKTKVDISVSKERGGAEAYDGAQFYRRPALQQPVRPAIAEQVAALLQGRPYNVKNVPPGEKDTVCLVQRAGLETGTRFSVNDP